MPLALETFLYTIWHYFDFFSSGGSRVLTVIRLGSTNVFFYLAERGICSPHDLLVHIERLSGKNMNLLVHLSGPESSGGIMDRYLVKQGPVGRSGIPKDGFEEEWRYAQLLRCHSELSELQGLASQPIAYDKKNEIVVYRYFQGYQDLGDFYVESKLFPPCVAAAMGASLALFHGATFQRNDYLSELDPDSCSLDQGQVCKPDYRHELGNLTPSIFERVSVDGMRFYELYQRSPDLADAIEKLEAETQRCCLIHGDLKFNNILLHDDWLHWSPQKMPSSVSSLLLADGLSVVRVIDWEQWSWGDPAFDVGALVADYLRSWLRSVMLSRDIDLSVALRFAAVPLEMVQPSLQAFLQAYSAQFPRIADVFPGFFDRVFQFAGLGLIHMIQAKLHYHEPFGTVEKSMLQVAKSLLCQPDAARKMILGDTMLIVGSFAPDGVMSNISIPIQVLPCQAQPGSQASPPLWVSEFSPDRMLSDLIESIHIDPPLIVHPAYEPLNLASPGEGYSGCLDSGRYHDLPEDVRQTYLLGELKNYIHDIYFSGEQERRWGSSVPSQQLINNTIAGLEIDFLGLLQGSNHGTGFLDPDWVIVATDGGRIQIEKDGLFLWVIPDVDLDPLVDVSLGSLASLRMPHALFAGEYYVAIGNVGEPFGDQPRVSIYFNVSAEGALILMDFLSRALNALECRYTFKVLNSSLLFDRYDSAALEIQADSYPLLHKILVANLARIYPHLSRPVPLFSCPLAPGIGLVESPEDGTDFGLSRCGLMAQVLLNSQSNSHSRRELMVAQFVQNGLDWSRPYLNTGSTSRYAQLNCDPLRVGMSGCHPVTL
jgi:hypothetical protein